MSSIKKYFLHKNLIIIFSFYLPNNIIILIIIENFIEKIILALYNEIQVFYLKLFMKKLLFLFFSFLSFSALNLYADVKLSVPYDLDTKELNKEEKDKLQNTNYSKTISIPQQYKGKLKYTEGVPEVRLKDFRGYFGAGGRYSFVKNTNMRETSDTPTSAYFNKNEKWEFKNNFNFFASAGLYWINGVRLEFEYSEMTAETDNFGKNFSSMNDYKFNQYLQEKANITTTNILGTETTYLTNNSYPLIQFSVKTYMINFVFENVNAKSKLRPYVGIGGGVVVGDMANLKTDKKSIVPGGQIMIGLSYPISEQVLVAYLGYRAVIAKEMSQTFTRIYGAEDYNGKTYKNPQMMQVKEKFKYSSQNIDLGFRFFF